MTGPLHGLRIIEFGGIGPGPFAGMMLADHGAEVIRIDRPRRDTGYREVTHRSRRSLVIDLKRPEAIAIVRALTRTADGLIEGFRPGTMERLGIGPDILLEQNPRLVYGRMTGWSQTGPLAQAAGHDLNYIALSGALGAMGRPGEKPPVPLNLVGDYGAGGMMLAFGMVSAMLAARTNGVGQVVDAAISDGAALLMTMFCSTGGGIDWQGERGTNTLSGSAPFYDTYETRDGQFVAIGAVERRFQAILLEKLGLADDRDFATPRDPTSWPRAKAKLTALFLTRSREEWARLLESTDACFAPVLSLRDAPAHPHNAARGTFVEAFGLVQPAPAPRYSRSSTTPPAYAEPGADAEAVLHAVGFSASEIAAFIEGGVVAASPA